MKYRHELARFLVDNPPVVPMDVSNDEPLPVEEAFANAEHPDAVLTFSVHIPDRNEYPSIICK